MPIHFIHIDLKRLKFPNFSSNNFLLHFRLAWSKKPSIYNVFLFQSAVKYHFGRHDTAWILFGDASWRSDANDRSFSLLISLRVSLATVAMETPACCSNWCWWLINKQLSVEWCDVISSPVRCCCCRFSLLRWFWNHTFTYSFSDSFVLQSPARMWRCSSNPAGSSGFRGWKITWRGSRGDVKLDTMGWEKITKLPRAEDLCIWGNNSLLRY